MIFEDELTFNFHPITLTRPAFDLVLGSKTLIDAILDEMKPELYSLNVSEYLEPITVKRHPNTEINPQKVDEEVIFINALLRPDIKELSTLLKKGNFVAFSGDNLALAKVSPKIANEAMVPPSSMARTFSKKFKGYYDEFVLPKYSLIRYPWQLIGMNSEIITRQISNIKSSDILDISKNITVSGPDSNLIIHDSVEIYGNVFFDVKEGPIHVSSGAKILPFSSIKGPVHIGKNAIISSAIIGKGTTLGDYVKVGGEINKSIFAGYSNKAHRGYMGHTYVGEWVNIGAMTTNSDLKNTYGTVKVRIKEEMIDSGETKIGNFIADNVKTSIGTTIYTGKKLGVASHLHSYVVQDVPSFTIYAKGLGCRLFEVDIESAIETQRNMMKRRGVEQMKEDADLLRKLFEKTQEERYKAGVIKGNFSFY
ncbi:MAG: hypothetical protein L6N96_05815 [Candidatus Methylarchaceae archaeon HK02M2]|nr:hypothetical protein [Candidatus Methylarchaceae archaeon HK02M2]